MTEAPPALPSRQAVARSPLLGRKLGSLRRKHVGVAVLTGVAMVVVVAVELLALAMFLDWWLDLPWGVRLVSLAAQLAVFTGLVIRYLAAPLTQPPDEDDLALMVEKARPEFRSRLIAALQLTRPGAVTHGGSTALVCALVNETEALARPIEFRQIVPTERLKKIGALAILVPALALAGFFYGRDVCADLLKRVFLSHVPVPRKTRVLVPDGHKIIGLGDSVRLEAWVQGIIPASGKLRIEYRNRRAQEFSLEQDRDERGRFGRTIENVQDSFRYTIRLGDGVSPAYDVKAIPRPTVAAIQCAQEYPAYTKLQPVKRSLGDLSLLAGSKLSLTVTATKPVRSAALKLVGLTNAADVPLTVNARNPKELAGAIAIPARGLTGFSVQMLDTDGMESRDSAVYRVEIIPDKVPVVRLTYPDRKEELITRLATMLVAFDAADDFEIAKVRLKYKVDTVDNGAEKVVELDLAGETPPRLRRRHEWKIGAFSPLLSEGSTIEYWIEVEDNNNATGPGLGSTDHQLAKVVSENEKRADLLNRAGDYLGSIGDVATDQEKLNKSLGAIILEKTGPRQ
jgi:hypothetical protein